MSEEESIKRYCRQMRASLAAALSSGSLLTAMFFWNRHSDVILAVLGFLNLVSMFLFSFQVDRIARLLGRNWIAWTFGSIVFSPAGALVAYFRMKALAQERAWWPE